MQTVIEPKSYLAAAKDAGMSEDDRADVVTMIASDPTVGVHIGGGVRKVRVAGRGKGKSGGFRVVFYFDGIDIPAALLTVFGKGEKANLTDAEKRDIIAYAATVRASLSKL
jgi:hypothetical protein